MTDRQIEIRRANWLREEPLLMAVRIAVFVEEQGVPLELESDEQDPDCYHLLALTSADEPVGTARLTAAGQIGRMAVMRPWRGIGIGRRLLYAVLQIAGEIGMTDLFLNAQCNACGFYRKAGFRCEGPIFLEAGIPHQSMRKPPPK